MRVHCRTNIDNCRCLLWPNELPALPNIGDLIRTATRLKDNICIELQVTRITWMKDFNSDNWIPEIELTVPTGRYPNNSYFYNFVDYAIGSIDANTYRYRQDALWTEKG